MKVDETKDYPEGSPVVRLSVEPNIPGRLLAEVITATEAVYGRDSTSILTETSDESGVPPSIVIVLRASELNPS